MKTNGYSNGIGRYILMTYLELDSMILELRRKTPPWLRREHSFVDIMSSLILFLGLSVLSNIQRTTLKVIPRPLSQTKFIEELLITSSLLVSSPGVPIRISYLILPVPLKGKRRFPPITSGKESFGVWNSSKDKYTPWGMEMINIINNLSWNYRKSIEKNNGTISRDKHSRVSKLFYTIS